MLEIIKKRRILLVDDNPVNIKILEKILSEDYYTETAMNGVEALKKLQESSNFYSLVILDIIMPIMDGYEVLRRMRANPALKTLPVIVASGSQKTENINVEEKALMLGANDYIIKPYAPNILKRRIENTLYVHDTSNFVTMAKRDTLTDLYSKEYFYLKAEEILKQNPNEDYDLVCCDIERFKLVNDLYGIDTGDNLLKSCAEIFTKNMGEYGISGRVGPDVFAFLILHQYVDYSSDFNETITRINELNIGLDIELKFGIYHITNTNEPVAIMCDRAKLAIKAIKGKYEYTYQYYDENIRDKLIEEQYLTTHMKHALENHEFEVYFQPKYEIKTFTITGAEALVRWNDPKKGYLSPNRFIPLFEKNGFITDLDKYVWEESIKFLKNWIEDGHPPISISVNVSRNDMFNPNIDTYLFELIERYKLNPQLIHLEITESAYTDNPKQLIDMANRLKAFGFKIDMDDFGTGYSSLNMLSDLPIDVLKLDMGFMKNEEMSSNRSILSFIISLAKWMKLEVVAEGVEIIDQVNLLKSLGCNIVQGFYFSRPLKKIDFQNVLKRQETEQEQKINSSKNIGMIPTSSVLLISENKQNRDIFDDIFKGTYFVHIVDYKIKLEELLRKHQQIVDLAIVDYRQSLSDDLIKQYITVCKKYNVPIIIALPNKDQVEKAISLGFTDFLTKPYRKISTLNRVNVIVSNAKLSEESMEREISVAIAEMKQRAEHDSLTGLLNRVEFEKQVDSILPNAELNKSYFIMMDIDEFKSVNDTFGHNAGDNILKQFANHIKRVFANGELIARMGGDEFAVYVPFCSNQMELHNRVDKLCNSFNNKINNKKVTCSAGIYEVTNKKMTFLSLYENADVALLTAKRSGKNQYCFYKNGMEIPVNGTLERNAMLLLDGVSDATFVCDAETSEIIYMNDTASKIIDMTSRRCLGRKCYEVFWDQCHTCDRCSHIDNYDNSFYEEDTVLKDGITPVHIKAKIDNWGGRKVKIHYLQQKN